MAEGTPTVTNRSNTAAAVPLPPKRPEGTPAGSPGAEPAAGARPGQTAKDSSAVKRPGTDPHAAALANAPQAKMSLAEFRKAGGMKKGDKDAGQQHNVHYLQQQLKDAGYYKGNVDGQYGKETADAVHKFQHDHGIKEDGKVGPETQGKLKDAAGKKADDTAKNTDADGQKELQDSEKAQSEAQIDQSAAKGRADAAASDAQGKAKAKDQTENDAKIAEGKVAQMDKAKQEAEDKGKAADDLNKDIKDTQNQINQLHDDVRSGKTPLADAQKQLGPLVDHLNQQKQKQRDVNLVAMKAKSTWDGMKGGYDKVKADATAARNTANHAAQDSAAADAANQQAQQDLHGANDRLAKATQRRDAAGKARLQQVIKNTPESETVSV